MSRRRMFFRIIFLEETKCLLVGKPNLVFLSVRIKIGQKCCIDPKKFDCGFIRRDFSDRR